MLYGNDTHCRYEDGIPQLHIYHCTFGAFTGDGRVAAVASGKHEEERQGGEAQRHEHLRSGDRHRQAAFGDLRRGAPRLLPADRLSLILGKKKSATGALFFGLETELVLSSF